MPPAPASGPELWLWAWEHPQDLRFLDADVGVAFLASTLFLSREGVAERPRAQPLRVRPDQPLVAVMRIESPPGDPLPPDRTARDAIVEAALRLAEQPGVRGVQIDFDAATSQRPAYALLLSSLRAALPGDVSLSMTALASWCEGDLWLGDAVDEVVPMLFEMGPDGGAVRDAIARRGALRSPRCQGSVGHMIGDPWLEVDAQRIYVFKAGPWTPAAVEEVHRRIG